MTESLQAPFQTNGGSAVVVDPWRGTHVRAAENEALSLAWFDALAEIGRAVNHAKPLQEVLTLIADTVCRLMDYDFCGVMMSHSDPPRLVFEGTAGLSAEYVARVNTDRPVSLLPGDPAGDGPTSRAFRSLTTVAVPDMKHDRSLNPWTDLFSKEGFTSMLAVPLVASGTTLGVLTCYTARPHQFEAWEQTRLECLAEQAAIAIEAANQRLREQETIDHLQSLNAVLGTQRRLLERTEALHRDLMALALSGSDLPGIVAAVRDVVGSPVVLSGPDLPTVPHGATLSEGPIDLNHQASIVENGAVVGRLTVEMPETDPSEAAWRRRALESGALVISLQLQRASAAQEERLRYSGELLGRLLNPDSTMDAWAVYRQASQLGHDLTQPHSVMVLCVDKSADSHVQVDLVAAQRRIASIARSATEHLVPRPLVGPLRDFVALLIPTATTPDHAATRELAERLQARVRGALGPLTVSVAIGPTCADLDQFADVAQVAVTALGLRLRQPASERIVSLRDMGLYSFLLQTRRTHELTEFAAELLDPIREPSRGVLLPTLKAFLNNKMNTTETARELFVHPNTVTYRMSRVEEILGIDLRDTDVLLKMTFALLINDLASG